MTLWRRSWMVAIGVFAAGLLVAVLLLQRWLGSDLVRDWAAGQLSAAAGARVSVGRVALDLWPVPALALLDVALQTRAPLLVQRVQVRPSWDALLRGRIEVASLLLRQADLPQVGLDEWLLMRQKAARAEPVPSVGTPGLPHRVVVESLAWRSTAGELMVVDADAHLDVQGWPAAARVLVVKGPWAGTQLDLLRVGSPYQVQLALGGGTVRGTVELSERGPAKAGWVLAGRLETKGVAMAGLTGNRLGGALEASTELSASAPTPGALADVLQTRSHFTVRNAVLQGVDLARAVKTVGLSRGGQTPLDTLTGKLATRGRAVMLSDLVASSGALSARGDLTVSPSRVLSGRVVVNLGAAVVGDVLGVPLVVSGTLDAPQLMLTRSALVGAAIGTMVMPGIGTGAGATLGDKIGGKLQGLFGK